MTTSEAGDDQGSSPVGALSKALSALLGRIHEPAFAMVLALVVIVAIVVVGGFAGSTPALYLIGVVALAAMVFVGWTLRERTKVAATSAVDLNDTVKVAAQLPDAARKDISRALALAAAEAAGVVGAPSENVRANLFGVSPDNKLSILPGLTHHMDQVGELGLRLDPGQGSTGIAFASAVPNVAVLRKDWEKANIPPELLAMLHPELRWIVSLPVFADLTRRPMWILNVDGLRDHVDRRRLEDVVRRLVYYAQIIAVIVARATTSGS